jgi:hypothetical protein
MKAKRAVGSFSGRSFSVRLFGECYPHISATDQRAVSGMKLALSPVKGVPLERAHKIAVGARDEYN